MPWYILAAQILSTLLLVVGSFGAINDIGKPRKPLTGKIVSICLVFNILILIAIWGR